MRSFPKGKMKSKTIKKIKKAQTNKNWSIDKISTADSNCVFMFEWVNAMVEYYPINEKIKPLLKKAAAMKKDKARMDAALAKVQGELDIVMAKVKLLNDEKTALENNAKRLQDDIATCKKRLANADILTSLLADEGVRWKNNVVVLGKDMECLVGDTFVSAALISYCGAFTSMFRKDLAELWVQKCKDFSIPGSD